MLPVHHTFGPLADDHQVRRALAISYTPWKYKYGESLEQLRSAVSEKFNAPAWLFSSGREALLAFLLALELKPGDEVIVQGYTCVVVPNAIVAGGGKPIYADIDRDSLNLDVETVRDAITPNTRAVICQHTFGIPSETEALRALCDSRGILLIEDCAHIVPDSQGPNIIGTFGDAIILSFGRDKAVSGVTGGALICRNKKFLPKIESLANDAKPLSWWKIHHLIHYPLVYRRALPMYGIGLGKLYVRLARFFGNLVPIVTEAEKNGHMPRTLQRMPNACAYFAIEQWHRLKEINDSRRGAVQFYLRKFADYGWLEPHSPVYVPLEVRGQLPLQKVPIFVKDADRIRKLLKQKQIYLDDGWAGCIVCPASADSSAVEYEPGSDPEAESVCGSILNLPTHPQMRLDQARFLMRELRDLINIG